MKKRTIVANWKSHKNLQETQQWIVQFKKSYTPHDNMSIILAVPFTLLSEVSQSTKDISYVSVASETVSPYAEGSHTGEVSAEQIKEFADYVLIGHSETRTAFHQTEEDLNNEVQESLRVGLHPLYFIQTADMSILDGVSLVAYERPDAISDISGGVADNPDQISAAIQKIGEKYTGELLYGGSVNASNIQAILAIPHISGVVIGKESLDVHHFLEILKYA